MQSRGMVQGLRIRGLWLAKCLVDRSAIVVIDKLCHSIYMRRVPWSVRVVHKCPKNRIAQIALQQGAEKAQPKLCPGTEHLISCEDGGHIFENVTRAWNMASNNGLEHRQVSSRATYEGSNVMAFDREQSDLASSHRCRPATSRQAKCVSKTSIEAPQPGLSAQPPQNLMFGPRDKFKKK